MRKGGLTGDARLAINLTGKREISCRWTYSSKKISKVTCTPRLRQIWQEKGAKHKEYPKDRKICRHAPTIDISHIPSKFVGCFRDIVRFCAVIYRWCGNVTAI